MLASALKISPMVRVKRKHVSLISQAFNKRGSRVSAFPVLSSAACIYVSLFSNRGACFAGNGSWRLIVLKPFSDPLVSQIFIFRVLDATRLLFAEIFRLHIS